MSETQEVPIPQETKDVPPLSPEVEQQRRAAFERVQAEAQDPSAVVSRSINEMGFFEGLMKVTEPYRKEKVNIMWKNLKAKTSLVLSLIPVVGEGKAFLGLSQKVSKGKIITRFEPAVRINAAVKVGHREFGKVMGKTVSSEKFLSKIANMKPVRFIAGSWEGSRKASQTIKKIASVEAAMSVRHLEKANALFKAKNEAASYAKDVYKVKKAEEAATRGVTEKVAWFDAIGKYKLWRAGKVAGKASKEAYTQSLRKALGEKITSTGKIGSWVQEKKAMLPTEIKVGLQKKKFMAFFDSVFNLTPDVPFWLTMTTAAGEMVGMHGIDAIPAVIQLGKNSLHEAKITRTMMKDVWRYTNDRLLGSRDVPRAAREVYAAAKGATGAVA